MSIEEIQIRRQTTTNERLKQKQSKRAKKIEKQIKLATELENFKAALHNSDVRIAD